MCAIRRKTTQQLVVNDGLPEIILHLENCFSELSHDSAVLIAKAAESF